MVTSIEQRVKEYSDLFLTLRQAVCRESGDPSVSHSSTQDESSRKTSGWQDAGVDEICP